jgi:signal peptidase I
LRLHGLDAHRSRIALSTSPASSPPAAPEEVAETPLEALASICCVFVVALFVMTFVAQNFEIPSASMENTLLIGDHVLVDRATLAPGSRWTPFVHNRPVHRGDVIVFLKPHSETPDMILVKRAIGIPGDHIHLRHGIVFVNGVEQHESYAQMPDEFSYVSYRDDFPSDVAGLGRQASEDLAARADCQTPECINQDAIDNRTITWATELPAYIEGDDLVVPPGAVFAMGDNRTQSLDGRFWGFVPQENILGRPLFVYWSFETPADQENKTSIGDRIGFMFHVVIHIFDETRWKRTFHVIR